MASLTFSADVNKTVTVNGTLYTLTPVIPDNLTVYLNEVQLTSGHPVSISEDATLTFTVATAENATLAIATLDSATLVIDGKEIDEGAVYQFEPGLNYTATITGATTIPNVTINGENITSYTINGVAYSASNLPTTFQPPANSTSSIYVTGNAEAGDYSLTLAGTNIGSATVNGEAVTLPYKTSVSEDTTVSMAGEVYQVDLTSKGGATLTQDGTQINDGNSTYHNIIDITKDTYLVVDGTHTLTITGEDIKSIIINGVNQSIDTLPVIVNNNKMSVTVSVNGAQPSTVHVVGNYMETVTLDGTSYPVNEEGSVDFSFTTQEDSHYLNIIGSQPREYGITWNDNNSTTIAMDGATQTSGTTSLISKDVYVEANPEPVPVHFESSDGVTIEVNGKLYTSSDFTINVDESTEIDVNTATCTLTIDYGDNSYQITVPQALVTLTAPHRDGWLFDGWSSTNLGISDPKQVRCTVDLTEKSYGNLVAHYQRYVTVDKPNNWN